MDKCGICLKPAVQLFETDKEGVYACFKCQPLVPEVTIGDNLDQTASTQMIEIEIEVDSEKNEDSSDNGLNCGICNKSFTKNGQLQAHIRNHRAERRFVCMYCNKAFSQSNNLRAHLRIHTNERPYKCAECGKAFTQVTNLNNHVRLHTGERPFICPEPGCGKAYAQVTNLNQHRKRHLNGRFVESSYDCPVCGQSFQQRNHMFAHRREVHGDARPPPKRYVCKLCDAALPSERQLQAHVAQHTSAATHTADTRTQGKQLNAEAEQLSCVFRSCNARFSSPHEHTEHLLQAHQLRVLTNTAPSHSKRGRPPKVSSPEVQIVEEPSKPPSFDFVAVDKAHQLRVLTNMAPSHNKWGRPPKVSSPEVQIVEEPRKPPSFDCVSLDKVTPLEVPVINRFAPLVLKPKNFRPIKIINATSLKLPGMQ